MKSKTSLLQMMAVLCTVSFSFGIKYQDIFSRQHLAEVDGIQTEMDSKVTIQKTAASELDVLVHGLEEDQMVLQIIKLRSDLSELDLLDKAKERADQFRKLPGLIQKYYVKYDEPGTYGGIYLWDSKESMMAFSQTELAATIPSAYKIVGAPNVEISDLLFKLRE